MKWGKCLCDHSELLSDPEHKSNKFLQRCKWFAVDVTRNFFLLSFGILIDVIFTEKT